MWLLVGVVTVEFLLCGVGGVVRHDLVPAVRDGDGVPEARAEPAQAAGEGEREKETTLYMSNHNHSIYRVVRQGCGCGYSKEGVVY